MTIFSLDESVIPEGNFVAETKLIGTTREECLAALQGQCLYFEDVGASTRSDSYLDEHGDVCMRETPLYTLIGGSIR